MPRARRWRRWPVITAAVVLLAVAVTGGVVVATGLHHTPDQSYLKALRAAGLGGQFSSDANAVAHAKAFCRGLDGGGEQQGMPVDQLAVKYYCPKFSQGFHVLQTASVTGTFKLTDTSTYSSGITAYGDSCTSSGGYSDIGPGTAVVVKNDAGKTLATTSLGAGSGDSLHCTFNFAFSVTEGENDYVVAVSHRGEQHYTFTQLQNDGVHLTLGD